LEAKHSNQSTAKELGKKAWQSGVEEPGRAAGKKIEGAAQAGDRAISKREERMKRRVSNAKDSVQDFNEQAKRDSFGGGVYESEEEPNKDFEQPTADDVDFDDGFAGGDYGVEPREGVGEDHNPESDRAEDDSDVDYADDDAWAGGPEGNRFRSGDYGDPEGAPRPDDSADPADQPPSSGSTAPSPSRRATGEAQSDTAEAFGPEATDADGNLNNAGEDVTPNTESSDSRSNDSEGSGGTSDSRE
jgi:hypothetical protein